MDDIEEEELRDSEIVILTKPIRGKSQKTKSHKRDSGDKELCVISSLPVRNLIMITVG